jgi:N utilization substance protein B
MVSRRLIRIKTFQIVFAQLAKQEEDFDKSYKDLKFSIEKTKDLYFLILRLIIDLKDLAEEKIELNKQKKLPTEEDLNPKLAFVENAAIAQLENNLQYQRYAKDNALHWNDHKEFVKSLLNQLQESNEFKFYINKENPTYKDDKKILSFLLEEIIGSSETILEILEEQSIYWTEDFEFVVNVLLKSLRTMKKSDEESALLSKTYKNDDDREFAYNLLKAVMQHHDDYVDLIDDYTKNWELERIMQVDILLMEMALAELITMPSIPIKVTLDEYIELSKFYSSSKSKVFINGVLDKLIADLKEKGEIVKKGRGLIGQV